jgi:beta-1,4-mannooligosaccharide/beta-1,4-mannosyl-N-acetylglucosamine phosphorylase
MNLDFIDSFVDRLLRSTRRRRTNFPRAFKRKKLLNTEPTNTEYQTLFTRSPQNPILTAKDWPYPAHTVFNAGACQHEGETVLLVRVEDRRGHSHLTVARSKDGVTDWKIDQIPSFVPEPKLFPEETWGIEDPRLTWVEDRNEWVIAYTAFSPSGPMVSLASTKDFRNFDRIGPVMPPEDKDAAVFPRRFDGRYAMIHRPVSSGAGGAHIWLSFSPDLRHWGDHHVLLNARRGAWWDANKIGLSPPPLETPDGWLLLYHGVRHTPGGCIYRLGLALLDLENPWKVLHRSDEWIFAPELPYEQHGDVNGVVFPCGWILDEKTGMIRMYYGGADSCIAIAYANLSELLKYVKSCPTPGRKEKLGIVLPN